MTRWKAAAIHLSISFIIGAVAFALLYFVYYPQPYFKAAGADHLVLILLGVDVILGPLLTLVVFKSGKKTLKFDLATIALLQLSALCYGLYVMWFARPVFIVAVVDRIEIVYANSIEPDKMAQAMFPEFKKEPLFGPVYGVTRQPNMGAEQEEVLTASFNGTDIQFFPKYYVPRGPDSMKAFLNNAKKVPKLPKRAREAAEQYLAQHPQSVEVVGVPVKGRLQDYTILMDAKTGATVTALPFSAWDE
jgi:hypothetical protein